MCLVVFGRKNQGKLHLLHLIPEPASQINFNKFVLSNQDTTIQLYKEVIRLHAEISTETHYV